MEPNKLKLSHQLGGHYTPPHIVMESSPSYKTESFQTPWTPNQRRSNFKLPAFHEYFVFSCLIRKGINLGPPDLESPQKGASGNTHIIHFGPYPICPKITPLLTLANLSVARFIAMKVVAIATL